MPDSMAVGGVANMHTPLEHGPYVIWKDSEAGMFVATNRFDPEAEELGSHSVDGLFRMVDELAHCLASADLSNPDGPKLPSWYIDWHERGRVGRIMDPVKRPPNAMFVWGSAFSVAHEQNNRPRVHRPESATILNFSLRSVKPSVDLSAVKPSVAKVDFSRMRGPIPKSTDQQVREIARWRRMGFAVGALSVAGAATSGMSVGAAASMGVPVALAITGPIAPMAAMVVAATVVLTGHKILAGKQVSITKDQALKIAGHILAMGAGAGTLAVKASPLLGAAAASQMMG